MRRSPLRQAALEPPLLFPKYQQLSESEGDQVRVGFYAVRFFSTKIKLTRRAMRLLYSSSKPDRLTAFITVSNRPSLARKLPVAPPITGARYTVLRPFSRLRAAPCLWP